MKKFPEAKWGLRAREAYWSGDPRRAMRVVEQGLRAGPRGELNAWKCAILSKLGRLGEALREARDAIRLEPELLWVRALRGEIFRQAGFAQRGLQDFRGALALDPAAYFLTFFLGPAAPPESLPAWVHALRGWAARNRGDLELAGSELEAAVRLDASFGAAWGWLGAVRLAQGMETHAWRHMVEAQLLSADWDELHAWKGEVLARGGRHGEAVSNFSRAIDLGLTTDRLFLLRARSRAAAGDEAGHAGDLLAAMRLNPSAFRARFKESTGEGVSGFIKEYLPRLGRARLAPGRVRRRLESGHPRKALEWASAAVARDPTDPALYLLRAHVHRVLGEWDEARRDLDRAVNRSGSVECLSARAEFLHDYGMPMEAVDDLTQAVALRPAPELYFRRARLLFEHRQFEKSLEDYAKVLALAPDMAGAHSARAQVWLALNKPGPAVDDLRREAELTPDLHSMRLRLCEALALSGKPRKALAEFGFLEPKERGTAEGLTTLGFIQALKGDRADALRSLDRACALLKGGAPRPRERAHAVRAAAIILNDKPRPRGASRGKAGTIVICGTGFNPPVSMTTQVLRALSVCDVIFNNVSADRMMDLLRLLAKDCRPVTFRYEQDTEATVESILGEAAAGRSVGFLTFGNPMISGPLAHRLIVEAARRSLGCEVLGALSSAGAMLAEAGKSAPAPGRGFQVVMGTGGDPAESGLWDPTIPALVYFPAEQTPGWGPFFGGMVAASYPPGHEALLFEPHSEGWSGPAKRIPLKDVLDLSPALRHQCMMFIPAIGAPGA